MSRPRSAHRAVFLLGGVALLSSACTSGTRWVNRPFQERNRDEGLRLFDPIEQRSEGRQGAAARLGTRRAVINATPGPLSSEELTDADGDRPALRLRGAQKTTEGPVDGRLLGVFRNTYYDFPAEFNFTSRSRVSLMNSACQPIAEVPQGFFEAVCVQGSGTLKSGVTVSFAKRDCSCAAVCPRTDQKICFDALDQERFPWGRGATGRAITPLRSVAVDSNVVPLGTRVYISEYDGVLRTPGGTPHDGCFVAEDRGLKVQGKHVDIFTGNPSITTHLNEVVPSNAGVHVYVGTARCH